MKTLQPQSSQILTLAETKYKFIPTQTNKTWAQYPQIIDLDQRNGVKIGPLYIRDQHKVANSLSFIINYVNIVQFQCPPI